MNLYSRDHVSREVLPCPIPWEVEGRPGNQTPWSPCACPNPSAPGCFSRADDGEHLCVFCPRGSPVRWRLTCPSFLLCCFRENNVCDINSAHGLFAVGTVEVSVSCLHFQKMLVLLLMMNKVLLKGRAARFLTAAC